MEEADTDANEDDGSERKGCVADDEVRKVGGGC